MSQWKKILMILKLVLFTIYLYLCIYILHLCSYLHFTFSKRNYRDTYKNTGIIEDFFVQKRFRDNTIFNDLVNNLMTKN